MDCPTLRAALGTAMTFSSAGAQHVDHRDLGLIDGDGQPVSVLGALGSAVIGRQRGQGRALGLVGQPAVATR